MKPLMIIGTSATRRREIAMLHFGDAYELVFVSPDIDEKALRDSDPYKLTEVIARAKMDAVLDQVRGGESEGTAKRPQVDGKDLAVCLQERRRCVAVTFDQVVVWRGEIREKPESKEESLHFLATYSNSSLDTVQTTCLYDFDTQKWVTVPTKTTTYYRELTPERIQRVADKGHVMHAAGGFTVEDADMLACMIKIEPGTQEEVQGFSVAAVSHLLKEVA
ncbi:septum formation protein [Strigomonas culicis]|uniref:Septum formation protein n=1 Tax=Strigomonas culicis TaxID=28005 RepID=S9W8X5_9TRYP|nr:septum formation protein [Strigomonas culicis]EPY35691.1 septum formation protein [Strigomonas culicis]|eukprot:EPY25237.1 septum formation protein [Strigomonas culicis]